jgi:hypothetical protein
MGLIAVRDSLAPARFRPHAPGHASFIDLPVVK